MYHRVSQLCPPGRGRPSCRVYGRKREPHAENQSCKHCNIGSLSAVTTTHTCDQSLWLHCSRFLDLDVEMAIQNVKALTIYFLSRSHCVHVGASGACAGGGGGLSSRKPRLLLSSWAEPAPGARQLLAGRGISSAVRLAELCSPREAGHKPTHLHTQCAGYISTPDVMQMIVNEAK